MVPFSLVGGGAGGGGAEDSGRPEGILYIATARAALRCACVLFQGDCLGLEAAVPIMQGILPSLPLAFHQPLER